MSGSTRNVRPDDQRVRGEARRSQGKMPIRPIKDYWKQRDLDCDPAIAALDEVSLVLDGIGNRMRAIPAQSIHGIAAKATTLKFDTGLYPEDPERPPKDWDWDVECLHLFVEDVRRLAAATR